MRKHVSILIAIVVIALPAAAAETGFYVGGGFGVTSLDANDFNPDYAGLRLEQNNFGFKLFGGYRFLKYFGVEGGYTDFGNVRVWEGGNLDFYKEADVGVTMWSGYAVGLIPVSGKVDFFGKLGYASYDVNNRVTDDGETEDRSTSGTDLAYGAGINFRFKKLGMRIEGDWLKIPDTGGVFMVSGSLTYIF
jgi:Outer membrane protein beta-barrel domain